MKPMLAFALASCAAAPQPQPNRLPATAVPPLVAPLDSLTFYVGRWQCEGTDYVDHEKWQARIEVAPALDGKWLTVTMIGPGRGRTSEFKGYDPEAKRWRHVYAANDGSGGAMSSPGWSGNQMVFTPDNANDDTHATFTKIDDTHYSHGVSRGDHKLWEKVCHKLSWRANK